MKARKTLAKQIRSLPTEQGITLALYGKIPTPTEREISAYYTFQRLAKEYPTQESEPRFDPKANNYIMPFHVSLAHCKAEITNAFWEAMDRRDVAALRSIADSVATLVHRKGHADPRRACLLTFSDILAGNGQTVTVSELWAYCKCSPEFQDMQADSEKQTPRQFRNLVKQCGIPIRPDKVGRRRNSPVNNSDF